MRVQTLRTLIARICYEGERIGEVLSRTLQMLRDSPVWQHRLLAAQLLALSGTLFTSIRIHRAV